MLSEGMLNMLGLVLVYAVIGASLGAALLMERRGSSVDVRKVVHIGVGTFAFIWWMFSAGWIMLVFFTVPFAVVLFLAMLKDNAVSRSKLGDLSNNKGHKQGLFLYAISITILVLLCFPDHWVAASVGVMAMTWGDGIGSVVGKRFGKHKTINGKSLEGSLGVFAATAIMTAVMVLFYGLLASSGLYPMGSVPDASPVWILAPVAGLIATVVEAVCPGEFDNLAIPLTVTFAMVILGL